MRRITVAAALLTLGGAAAGLADDTVSFQAQLSSHSSSRSRARPVSALVFEGTGAATIIGHLDRARRPGHGQPCNPTEAETILVAATGSIRWPTAGHSPCQSPAPGGPIFIS
jgi:hypothetical protein